MLSTRKSRSIMAAKVSLNFGDDHDKIPIDKSSDFFQGCVDAFKDMGLEKTRFKKLVDLVNVVRIYPNQGGMSNGQIVIDVIVGWQGNKKNESFIVHLDSEDIRKKVSAGIVQLTKKLAKSIRDELKEQVEEFSTRLT